MEHHAKQHKWSSQLGAYKLVSLKIQSEQGVQMEVLGEDCLTVADVAALKQVSRTAVYRAIHEQRLPAVQIAGHTFILKSDSSRWLPLQTEIHAGAKRKGGRPLGLRMSEESKTRISEAQKRRWADKRQP
jgi:excisionase family DNA binding protein